MYIQLTNKEKALFPFNRLIRSSDNFFNVLDSWMFDAHESQVWECRTTDTEIIISVPVPGFKKSELEAEVSGRHLILRTTDDSDSNYGKIRVETAIHINADLAKYDAKLEDGIFSITFAKRQDILPVKQKITIA